MPEVTAVPAPAEQEQPRNIDPARVLQKLQLLDGNLVQLAVLQVVAEDQEDMIRQLRAELVKLSGGPS